jgi:ribosomal protein L34
MLFPETSLYCVIHYNLSFTAQALKCMQKNTLQYIPVKAKRMRWVGHMARMGNRGGAYRVLVRKSERKIPLGTHRHKSEDYIQMDLKELSWEHED